MSEETEKTIPADNNKGKASHNILVAFLSALLLCCGLYGMAIYLHNDHIVEGQNRIIRVYTHQIEKMEPAKTPLNMRDSQREKEMQAFQMPGGQVSGIRIKDSCKSPYSKLVA